MTPRKYPVSKVSPERPPRSLRGRSWFLTGVNDVFRAIDLLEMHRRNFILVLRSLAALEVSRLLTVSRGVNNYSVLLIVVALC